MTDTNSTTSTMPCATCGIPLTEHDTVACGNDACPIPRPALQINPEIKGTFERVSVPAARRMGPTKMALAELLAELTQLYMTEAYCPEYPSVPLPEDHRAFGEHARMVALILGRWLRKLGLQVRANALCAVDVKDFAEGTFLDAIEGFALGEIERAAKAAGDDLEDREAQERRARVMPLSEIAGEFFANMARVHRLMDGSKS